MHKNVFQRGKNKIFNPYVNSTESKLQEEIIIIIKINFFEKEKA